MRLIDADALKGKSVQGTIGNISGDFIPGFAVDLAQTVDPVKHGRWVPNRFGEYDCSVCKSCVALSEDWHGHPRYCSVCGAKMEVSDEKA